MSLAPQTSFNFLAEEHGGVSTVRLHLMSTLTCISLVCRCDNEIYIVPRWRTSDYAIQAETTVPRAIMIRTRSDGKSRPSFDTTRVIVVSQRIGSHWKPVLALVQEGNINSRSKNCFQAEPDGHSHCVKISLASKSLRTSWISSATPIPRKRPCLEKTGSAVIVRHDVWSFIYNPRI